MDELSVSDIMTPVTFTLPVTASARDLADFLVRGRIHRAVVVEDGRLQGIVTTMDILRALAHERI
jgi:CBS domain-containing protein